MDLFIKITSGTRTGDVFKIQSAATIGRSKADINLKDSRASSLHGKILEENGDYFYVDLNSTNGSLVAGVEVKKIKLIPGLVITIGSTNLEITTEFEVKKSSKANLSEWRETLFNFLQKQNIDQTEEAIHTFHRCLLVTVKSGIQAGESWILGYGPRKIGPLSSDICLLDETLDGLCLKIHQNDGEIVVESLEGKTFTIDGQKKGAEVLKDKLDIQIGNTLLEIGYLNHEVI